MTAQIIKMRNPVHRVPDYRFVEFGDHFYCFKLRVNVIPKKYHHYYRIKALSVACCPAAHDSFDHAVNELGEFLGCLLDNGFWSFVKQ